MKTAVRKAAKSGVGIVSVRNSNHFGIAGYYTQLMLNEGMLGVAMTNASSQIVPTFARRALLGTNPISVAVPAKRHLPFLLDMATSVVPRNRLDVYKRRKKPIPEGWAVNSRGKTATDAGAVLQSVFTGKGGGLLPLGEAGELLGGHKGYGLALLIDIFCGVLSGGCHADQVVSMKDGILIETGSEGQRPFAHTHPWRKRVSIHGKTRSKWHPALQRSSSEPQEHCLGASDSI